MPAAHILTYARDLAGGGVERALLRLADGWVKTGRQVTLVIGQATSPLARELPPGITLVELGTPSMRRLALAVPREVRARAPDVLFCPGNHYSSIAAWTRIRLGRACPPIVAKLSNAVRRGDHGAIANAGHRAWLALHGRFLDHLVAMTPATALEAATATGMAGRVSAIPNPPPGPLPNAPLPPLPNTPFILGVGRLARQKRWDRLVAAMPDLDAPVVILGDGPNRASLLAQAAALGVADRLHLPGHAADPLAVMARARVLALTSDYEGVPGVLREALSVGTPVVTTDSSPAIREIVTEPSQGTVVQRDDHQALLMALQGWLVSENRPTPVAMPGTDSARRYLELFDSLPPNPLPAGERDRPRKRSG